MLRKIFVLIFVALLYASVINYTYAQTCDLRFLETIETELNLEHSGGLQNRIDKIETVLYGSKSIDSIANRCVKVQTFFKPATSLVVPGQNTTSLNNNQLIPYYTNQPIQPTTQDLKKQAIKDGFIRGVLGTFSNVPGVYHGLKTYDQYQARKNGYSDSENNVNIYLSPPAYNMVETYPLQPAPHIPIQSQPVNLKPFRPGGYFY